MDFGNFLGNETLKARIAASTAQGKLSHCYLITGPKGSGKHTLCQVLLAAMQCTAEHAPCWRCGQCHKVMQHIHPDVIWVDDPARKTIPVDLIRQTCSDAYIRPNEGQRKIYVIPRAQDLGLPGQNALLKMMEEPPSYVAFLLLCENPDKMLPTIRSRCVELQLSPLPMGQLMAALQAQYPQREVQDLQAAASRSGGFLGQALEQLSGQDSLLSQSETFALAFSRRDRLQLLQLLVNMEKMPRANFRQCLLQWIDLLEQAMLVRSGIDSPMALCRELAKNRTMSELMQALEQLRQAANYCEANVGVGHLCGALAATLL